MKTKLLIIAAGVGVSITAVMLAIAYIPNYYPTGYERLHTTGFVKLVPLLAAIQIGASVGLLYLSSKKEESGE